jgi:hypothetical protein
VIFMCAISITNISLKQYLEGQVTQLTGRKVSLWSVRINPFNASITLYGFRLFEKDSDTVFVSFDRFHVNTNHRCQP